MSLTLSRDTVDGRRPVFAKVIELFTGGFGYAAGALTSFTSGVTLPKGALLRVDESARTCMPIKRAITRATIASGAATGTFSKDHLFEVGDRIQCGGTGTFVSAVTEGDTTDTIVVSTFFRSAAVATGVIAYHVGTTSGATGPGELVTAANALVAYPSSIEAGASVTALRRGTVYANRIQRGINTDYDSVPVTVLYSESS